MKKIIRILIVNTDPVESNLIRIVFEKKLENTRIFEAFTRSQIKKKLTSTEVDLILIDYDLGKFNGLDIINDIQDLGLDIPVLMLTDPAADDAVVKAIGLCVEDCVTKSLEYIQKLPAKVVRIIVRYNKKLVLQNLQNEEEKILFDSVFESSPFGIFLIDKDGLILRANSSICTLLGYKKGTALSVNITDYCYHDEVEEVKKSILTVFTGEMGNYQAEKRFLQNNGTYLWCELSVFLIRNNADDPQYCALQLKDISEQKQVNFSLFKQSALSNLFGNIAIATNEVSTFDNALKVCLNEVCEYTGWPLGHAYLVDDVNSSFIVSTSRFPESSEIKDYRKLSNSINFTATSGLPGRVLRTRRPAWVSDFNNSENFLHAELLIDFGLEAGFAFPIYSKDEVIAVIEFFCQEVTEPDFDFLEVMIHIGNQLGHIFEREKSRKSLLLSEEKFSTAFRSSPDAISIISMPDSKFVEVNERFLILYDYRRHEVIGHTVTELALWRCPKQSENLLSRLRIHRMVHDMEAELCRSSGESISCQVSAEIINISGVEHILVLSRDITEKKRADNALKRSEGLLRSYFNAGFVGMAIISPENKFLQINNTVGDIFGYSKKHLLGMSTIDLTCPDEVADSFRLFNSVISGKIDGYSEEKHCVRKNGNIILVSVSTECVRNDDGSVDYLVAFFQDITERKLAEIALFRSNRALRVLNECIHTIVHASNGQEMINDICKIIIKTGGYRFAWVGYAQSDQSKTVYPVAKAGHESGYLDNDFSWNKDSKRFDPVSDVIVTGKLFVVKNLIDDDVYGILRNAALERGYRSEIALPLNVGDKAFGALMIYASEPDAFDKEEVKLLTNLADDLAFGILSLHTRKEHERSESLLRDKENKYRLLYNENPTMFFTIDEQGIILSVNKFGAEELGYQVEELIGTSVFGLSYDSYKKIAEEYLQKWLQEPEHVHRWEQQKICKDGKVLWVKETIRVITNNDGEKNIIIVCEDITETRKLSDQLSYQATHDSLTGLINRGEFEQRMKNLLASTRIENSQHALCYLDLDQFKLINDTCGHVAGDELLRQLAMLLMGQIRKRDTVARLGGDEFGILMEHCPLHRAEYVAKKLIKAIDSFQFVWERKIFRVGASIGIVPINSTSGNVFEILNNADKACYTAKDMGHNRLHISGEDDEGFAEKHGEMRRLTEIQEALATDRFQLYFQYIKPLKNRIDEIEHFEVLLRMSTDSDRLLNPDSFMPTAEKYNLSVDIDKWVINKIFDLLDKYEKQDKKIPQFFVNLSGHSLGNNELLEFIVRKFDQFLISPEKICFEITETVAIANLTNAIRFINVLRERGCLFALDDFGSGLSSYAYLKNLQVDYLKIDGMFVRDMTEDPMNLVIVKSMHEIGKALGKKTVAESVEDKRTCDMLREIGLDYVQGIYIAEVRSFEEISQNSPANIIKFSKRK